MYGLGTLASPSSGEGVSMLEKIMCFDPSALLPKAGSLGEKIARMVAVLPTASFAYYFVWKVILQGELVKPVQSDMHVWEAPLALTFSLVFIPFGLYAIFGSKLFSTTNEVLKWVMRILTLRPLTAVFLFAAFYVFVWRLQGGLFLNKSDHETLKKQVTQAHMTQMAKMSQVHTVTATKN